jgi:hypothetical protein
VVWGVNEGNNLSFVADERNAPMRLFLKKNEPIEAQSLCFRTM